MEAFCELNDKQDRIQVHFPYSQQAVAKVKAIPGARFVGKEKGGPYWLLPLDLPSARELRSVFGAKLELGKGIKAWGKDQNRLERNLSSLVALDEFPAEKMKLNKKLPELAQWFRPYQRADTKFMSEANLLNGNQPGLGKTTETIGAIYEADLEDGPHLVVAPKTSLDTVWRYEWERWTDVPVYTYHGDLKASERKEALEAVQGHIERNEAFVLACTPDTLRSKKVPSIVWNSFTIDEFHKHGLTNISGDPSKGTIFGRAAMGVEAKVKYCLSGTPMGGKPIKLWGAFRFLYPESFTAKWRWAEQWLYVTHNGFGYDIGGLRRDKADDFYKAHARFMVRRLKSEVLPQLPPKQYVDVEVEMTPKQRKQYKEFAAMAEVRIDEERLSATMILDEYARLKVFAFSYCDVERLTRAKKCSACKGAGCDRCEDTGKVDHLKLKPTYDSGKLPALLEKLNELGIDPDDPDGDSVAVVASQHKEVVYIVANYLTDHGITCEVITGDTKQADRTDIQRRFQAGGPDSPRVIVMTTTAGGVAITLDRADTVHILDETWVPDDQEQLEDRIHRASRMHQVMCYYYRSVGTVDGDIQELVSGKAGTNQDILDIRRQGYRATLQGGQ